MNNPKIGIRPTIDGRFGGVRESLEAPTMQMAQAAAKLISDNLYYSDGTGVECVISESCIGGVSEAAACEELFSTQNVGVTLTVTPCWCYGSETMDMNPHTIKAVWGFNGTERPGAVYLAAVLAAHAQKGLPAFAIYGHDVQDLKDTANLPKEVSDKILHFAQCGIAACEMRGKSYLSIGGVSMGIAGSIVDETLFQSYLGMRNEYVDMCEITRRIEKGIYDKDEFEKALAWVKVNCREAEDTNPDEKKHSRDLKDKEWEFAVKMTMIIRDLMTGNSALLKMGHKEESMGHNALCAGFQGQRQWTDYLPNGDFSEAILNSSFDWNGIRKPYTVATENDALNGVSMFFGNLLTNTAQIFADVRTYWSPEAVERVCGARLEGYAANGIIHLINSGAAALDGSGRQSGKNGEPTIKPFWEITEMEADECIKNTEWCPANVDYFRGGGYSSRFLSKGGMAVTMTRINMVKGLGPVLQLAEGYTCDIGDAVSDKLWQRTDPTWPCTWFAPKLTGKGAFKDVYSVMANWGANHGAISAGHIGAKLITLASMLRIPVSMHNADENCIMRPSAWASFGTDNAENADYRACAAFGPLYK